MIGNLPGGDDFNFNLNGYPCAIGVDTFNLDSGGDDYSFRLVKMKTKATEPGTLISQWEYIHHLALNGNESKDPAVLLKTFLNEANPKLQAVTGGVIPKMPLDFLGKCKHLVRFNLTFDTVSGDVVFTV